LLDTGEQDQLIERILWLDPERIHVVMIEIAGKNALPILRNHDEITRALTSGEAYVLKEDPYASLRRPENKIKKKHGKIRDRAWDRIAPLIENAQFELLLDPKKRGSRISERSEAGYGSWVTIYKDLRRYWQRGMIKNALLPDYDNCGAPGERRISTDQNAPKLGRKPLSAGNKGEHSGIRITLDIEKRFERGIKKFYETPDKRSFSDAFDCTKNEFFWIDMEFKDGIFIPVLPPAEQLPTLRQFRYWYENIYCDDTRKSKSREGEREYNLRSREILGDSTQMASGPGAIYQIDSTIGDIYLVSSFDRTRIIGRPVVYFCVDVFSRVISGFCVTLEGPSWLSGMLAIDNVVADKVAFCAEYGITITEEEWPCHHLPGAFLADRGEFEGYDADTLPNALGTPIHNTAPWRADWKGIVERQIGIANSRAIHFTPGAVIKHRGRGDPDYRLDAVLTLDDLRKLLIYYVLDYNMNHYMRRYRKDEFMIADHVARFPLDIWHWGARNGFSYLQPLSREIVRLNLLPRRMASITPRGIYLEGELYYTCDLAMREGWFAKARIRGRSQRIEVCVDPRSADMIYLPTDNGKALEPCYLTDASKHLLGHDFHDVIDYFALEKHAEIAARSRVQQSTATLQAQKEHVVTEATEKTRAAHTVVGKQSKAARTKGIRENRAAEKQIEREKSIQQFRSEGLELGGSFDLPIPGTALFNDDTEEYVPPASKVACIRSLRDKKWNEKGGQ
jgi:hypothetical protein